MCAENWSKWIKCGRLIPKIKWCNFFTPHRSDINVLTVTKVATRVIMQTNRTNNRWSTSLRHSTSFTNVNVSTCSYMQRISKQQRATKSTASLPPPTQTAITYTIYWILQTRRNETVPPSTPTNIQDVFRLPNNFYLDYYCDCFESNLWKQTKFDSILYNLRPVQPLNHTFTYSATEHVHLLQFRRNWRHKKSTERS